MVMGGVVYGNWRSYVWHWEEQDMTVGGVMHDSGRSYVW